MKLTLLDNKYELVEGPAVDSGTLTLKPDLSPKQMDIVGVSGPNAGRTIPAVYKWKGKNLIICYGLKGDRPSNFRSPKGSMVLLVTYQRAK